MLQYFQNNPQHIYTKILKYNTFASYGIWNINDHLENKKQTKKVRKEGKKTY